MAILGIKLGHRRKFQRENARRLGHRANKPLSGLPAAAPQARAQHTREDGITYLRRPKRECRRRAPRDPQVLRKSDAGYAAYARFICQDPMVSELSLIETAKLVGERWSFLPSDIKDMWNTRAAAQKGTDYSQLTYYCQTETCWACGSCSETGRLRGNPCEAQVNCNGALAANLRLHPQSGVPQSRRNAQALTSSSTSLEITRQLPCERAQDNSTSFVC